MFSNVMILFFPKASPMLGFSMFLFSLLCRRGERHGSDDRVDGGETVGNSSGRALLGGSDIVRI